MAWLLVDVPGYSIDRLAWTVSLPRFELLFRIQRQLDHSLEQLIRRCSGKILQHQLFDIQSHQVTQLQCTIARRKHKVAMTTVDDDDIAIAVETTAPQFSSRPFKRVARKAARIDNGRAHGGVQTVSHGDQHL